VFPWGIAVIAGTGSMAWGQSLDPKRNDNTLDQARCGGWGYLIGDEGSAYWIAAQALRALGHVEDGRAPNDPRLRQAVLEATQCNDWPAIIQWLYQDHAPRSRVASLTRTLVTHSNDSSTLQQIILTAATDLANQALRVAERLQLNAYPLKATGSLVVHSTFFRNEVFRVLQAAPRPPASITLVEHPVEGALHLAQRGLDQNGQVAPSLLG
jgi:N-acetylglucosamine kinase-like BadF-type ATPase